MCSISAYMHKITEFLNLFEINFFVKSRDIQLFIFREL